MWSSLLKGRKKPDPSPKPLTVVQAFGPPLTAEELGANLSELERRLNREMKCPAGKNQVFLRSLLTGNGTTPPRVALKCSYRRDIGLRTEVFYEHIRDCCCGAPDKCEAYRAFKQRFLPT